MLPVVANHPQVLELVHIAEAASAAVPVLRAQEAIVPGADARAHKLAVRIVALQIRAVRLGHRDHSHAVRSRHHCRLFLRLHHGLGLRDLADSDLLLDAALFHLLLGHIGTIDSTCLHFAEDR